MWYDTVDLLKKKYSTDDVGNHKESETATTIYCNVKKISNAMLFYASQFGFKPTLVIDVHTFEYNNETNLRFEGKDYVVKRIFRYDSNITELTCEEVGADKHATN